MKKIVKIIIGLFVCLFILFSIPRVVLYFFTKPAKPIMEYEFPNMTYEQLEVKISKITENKSNHKFNLTKEELLNPKTINMRKIIIGKDSLQFGFVTQMDKGYEYKTKNNHPKNSVPWLELYSICNSEGKYVGVFAKNKEEHPELIKLFEDQFIKKINDGKVNVIDRGFWDWF